MSSSISKAFKDVTLLCRPFTAACTFSSSVFVSRLDSFDKTKSILGPSTSMTSSLSLDILAGYFDSFSLLSSGRAPTHCNGNFSFLEYYGNR